ncbi:MAG: response regulator [Bacteroidales bacterium]|nr:response regulator [Bacteroidales bacterium]
MSTILAIDDDYSNLVLIETILKRNFPDSEIITSLSAEEGVKIAKQVMPDTILLDIMMAGMNGFEACEILKQDEETKHIPILLVSALGQNYENRVKGLNLGAEAFISKPFQKPELVSQVKVMLRIKKAEDLLRKQNQDLELFIKKQTKDFNTSENRFLQISEYANEYYWEINAEGKYTYVSAGIEKILGVRAELVINKEYLFDFHNSVNHEKSRDVLFGIFNKKIDYKEIEVLCRTKDGRSIWLTISGFPIFDEELKFIGYRGITHDVTLRRRAEEELKKSLLEIKRDQQKLKKLNSELLVVEEKERRRIAEYLHDGIGQILSYVHMNLSSIQKKNIVPDEIKEKLKKISGFLNEAIIQSRLLTYDLSPPILYELGLLPAIKWKLSQTESDHNVNTVFLSDIDLVEMNNDTKILTYRIVCELLANITKHAQANNIRVSVHKNDNFYIFGVTDDGKGFEYKGKNALFKKGGYGLFSISERLESIQGSLIIESRIDKGTKATFSIPIKNN